MYNKSKIPDMLLPASTIRLPVLIHAAKLSPFITDGRTIGPLENNEELVFSFPNKDNTKYQEKNDKKEETIISLQELNLEHYPEFLDYRTINASAAAKSTEKYRKELVRKQLEKRVQILSAENQKRKDFLISSIKKQNDCVNKKLESDTRIYEIAEKYVEEENLESNKKIEKILKERQRRLQEISLEAIAQSQKKFRLHYEKLYQVLKTDRNFIDCEDYNRKLKDLVASFDDLFQKIKTNIIGPPEILLAEKLCKGLQSLEENLHTDVNNKKLQIKQNIQAEVKPIPEIVKQENTTVFSQPTPVVSSNSTVDIPDSENLCQNYITAESLALYNDIMKFYNEKLELLQPLENDPNMKKFLAACRRNINIPVAAICAVSPQHLRDKFDKIFNFITGNCKKQTASDVHISEHPLAKDYCTRYLAKKFVSVAGTEISSNLQAAFPFASIIIALWNRIPEFGKLLLGQIFTQSTFLIPLFLPKVNGQSDVDYNIACGYFVTDNSLEDYNSYIKRQSGIVRLFAAIMISFGSQDNPAHPFPIENGWRWLCNFINLNPVLHDVCATVLVEFLQITSFEMISLYGNQFRKLIHVMQQQYVQKLSQIEEGKAASKSNLEQFLEAILKYNRIDKPQGILAKNFW